MTAIAANIPAGADTVSWTVSPGWTTVPLAGEVICKLPWAPNNGEQADRINIALQKKRPGILQPSD
jgi:hypothetical protein